MLTSSARPITIQYLCHTNQNMEYNFANLPTTITDLNPIDYAFTVIKTPDDDKCWESNPTYTIDTTNSGPDIATIVNSNTLQINANLNTNPGVWDYKVVYSQLVPMGCDTPTSFE